MALLQHRPLLLEYVFQRHPLVHEDLEMIGNYVPVIAVRTRYQHRAVVVAVFGDSVGGADLAGFASEG